jgi:hypothetical protein
VAVQTPPAKTWSKYKYTLIDWYLPVLRTAKKDLRLTNYVVADAYFSTSTFVDGVLEMGFHSNQSDLEMMPISGISPQEHQQVKEETAIDPIKAILPFFLKKKIIRIFQ